MILKIKYGSWFSKKSKILKDQLTTNSHISVYSLYAEVSSTEKGRVDSVRYAMLTTWHFWDKKKIPKNLT